jgi:tight adherence protein B
VTGFLLALAAAYGVFLLYTAVVFHWRGLGMGPAVQGRRRRRLRLREFLSQAGLPDVRPVELAAVMAGLAVIGAGLGYALFGGLAAPGFLAAAAAWVPVGSARRRRERRQAKAGEAWPRMLEEIRLQATTMGRSVPQALLDVGLSGPEELRPAFVAAQREWLISTDFERTLDVLKDRLADATADSVCETLLIAHEVGGADLDRRLSALIDDRAGDLRGRKDAVAKQAGARFARWFVVIVPAGMALAGLSIGEGRPAYGTPVGQVAVVVGLSIMALCWLWAGRIMRLPSEDRVFYR